MHLQKIEYKITVYINRIFHLALAVIALKCK